MGNLPLLLTGPGDPRTPLSEMRRGSSRCVAGIRARDVLVAVPAPPATAATGYRSTRARARRRDGGPASHDGGSAARNARPMATSTPPATRAPPGLADDDTIRPPRAHPASQRGFPEFFIEPHRLTSHGLTSHRTAPVNQQSRPGPVSPCFSDTASLNTRVVATRKAISPHRSRFIFETFAVELWPHAHTSCPSGISPGVGRLESRRPFQS
jgi:hypothetical protein